MIYSFDNCLNKLIQYKDFEAVKVLTGVRKIGKTYLIQNYMNFLKNNKVREDHLLYVNLDSYGCIIKNTKDLENFFKCQIKDNDAYYVFIEEIQKVDKFEDVLNKYMYMKNVDIYITYSNGSANIKNFDLDYSIHINILPISFKELYAKRSTLGNTIINENNTLNFYAKYGGIPGVISSDGNDNEHKQRYFDMMFSLIVYKDIMLLNKTTEKNLLESILKYIYANIDTPISTRKISEALTNEGVSISNHTVENYIQAFLASYLIYKVERYDIKNKCILIRDYKYYAVDTGLRNFILGYPKNDTIVGVLRNMVYFELRRRGYQVYVGKFGDKEINFVAINDEGKKYYQVVHSLKKIDDLNNELSLLKKIDDSYPKYIISTDEDLPTDYDGIKRVNFKDWLLDN